MEYLFFKVALPCMQGLTSSCILARRNLTRFLICFLLTKFKQRKTKFLTLVLGSRKLTFLVFLSTSREKRADV